MPPPLPPLLRMNRLISIRLLVTYLTDYRE
jgi:hypothetical protein